MKLDYLQFLELEVFTRFGARLEASMEARIKRGRLLRELLKQDRLDPLPIEMHMAWLIAFNEGLLDETDPLEIPHSLAKLAADVKDSDLTLDDSHDTWAQAVAGWLKYTDSHE